MFLTNLQEGRQVYEVLLSGNVALIIILFVYAKHQKEKREEVEQQLKDEKHRYLSLKFGIRKKSPWTIIATKKTK